MFCACTLEESEKAPCAPEMMVDLNKKLKSHCSRAAQINQTLDTYSLLDFLSSKIQC